MMKSLAFWISCLCFFLQNIQAQESGDFCVDLDATPLEPVDDESFEDFKTSTNVAVLIVVPNTECEYCRMMIDTFSDISDAHASQKGSISFGLLDYSDFPETADNAMGGPEYFQKDPENATPQVIIYVQGQQGAMRGAYLLKEKEKVVSWIKHVIRPVIWNPTLENMAGVIDQKKNYFLMVTHPEIGKDEETDTTTYEHSKVAKSFIGAMRFFDLYQAVAFNTTNAPFGLANEQQLEGIYFMKGDEVQGEFKAKVTKSMIRAWMKTQTFTNPVRYNKDFYLSLEKASPDTVATCFLTGPADKINELRKNKLVMEQFKMMKPKIWVFDDIGYTKTERDQPLWNELGVRKDELDVVCSPMKGEIDESGHNVIVDYLFPREHITAYAAGLHEGGIGMGIVEHLDEFVDIITQENIDDRPPRWFKSEDFGEDPVDEETGIVDISFHNFKDWMNDEKRDSLLFVYADDCVHCKKFKPTFEKIASLIYGPDKTMNQHIVMGKFNYKANSVSEMSIAGVPDVRVYTKNSTTTHYNEGWGFETYRGDRTAGKIVRWFSTHADTDFEMPDLSDVMKNKKKKTPKNDEDKQEL